MSVSGHYRTYREVSPRYPRNPLPVSSPFFSTRPARSATLGASDGRWAEAQAPRTLKTDLAPSLNGDARSRCLHHDRGRLPATAAESLHRASGTRSRESVRMRPGRRHDGVRAFCPIQIGRRLRLKARCGWFDGWSGTAAILTDCRRRLFPSFAQAADTGPSSQTDTAPVTV